MPVSPQTAAYLAIVAGETNSSPTEAYMLSNTSGGGHWTIGWIQQDFASTDSANAGIALSQALSASGAFSNAAAGAIAQVFMSNGSASLASINAILKNIPGGGTSVGAINSILENNSAAQNAITANSMSDFNNQWSYVLSLIQSPNTIPELQQALADPTVGPALEIMFANYNNQIGFSPGQNLDQLITTGSATFGGTTFSIQSGSSPSSVYNTIMNAIYNQPQYQNNPMQGVNRLGDSINASDYYDTQNGLPTLGNISLNNSAASVTFVVDSGASSVSIPETTLPEVVVTLPTPNVGPVDTSTINVETTATDITLDTPDFSSVLPTALPDIQLDISGSNVNISSDENVTINGASNTDTINGYNAEVSAEDSTIIIPAVWLEPEISAYNDYMVDNTPPPENLPVGVNDPVTVNGSGNDFVAGSNAQVSMSGSNNTVNVTGNNSDVNLSGNDSKIIIGAYTDQNTISTTVAESISAGIDAKFAVLASGVTISADGDDIYVDGTNDTIVDPYGRVEFASPSDVADYGDRVSGVDSSYGFGEGYGYGQYGEYGGYGFDNAPTSTGSNIGSIAAFDADSQNGRGAGAAETARLQAESSLSASAANAAPQFEGAKWSSHVVTWSLASGSDAVGAPLSGVIGSQYVSLIEAAFQTWGAASGLQFQEVSDSSSSDIRIGWNTFGASSGVLGYTGFNASLGVIGPGATISLEDPSEIALTTDANGQLAYSGTQTELEQLLLHEIGHALGLADDSDPNSIMNAVLGASNRTLDATDIAGIQTLYEQATLASKTASAAADVTTGLSDLTALASHSAITVASSLISNLTPSALTPFSTEADQLILAMAAFQPTASPTTFTPVTATSVASAMTLAAAGI